MHPECVSTSLFIRAVSSFSGLAVLFDMIRFVFFFLFFSENGRATEGVSASENKGVGL